MPGSHRAWPSHPRNGKAVVLKSPLKLADPPADIFPPSPAQKITMLKLFVNYLRRKVSCVMNRT